MLKNLTLKLGRVFWFTLRALFVSNPRRAEQFYITRTLPPGIRQFTNALPGEQPPTTRSLWATSDGYFYVLRLQQADVSHRAFVTPTLLAKAPWYSLMCLIVFGFWVEFKQFFIFECCTKSG